MKRYFKSEERKFNDKNNEIIYQATMEGCVNSEISQKTGLSKNTIQNRRQKMGISNKDIVFYTTIKKFESDLKLGNVKTLVIPKDYASCKKYEGIKVIPIAVSPYLLEKSRSITDVFSVSIKECLALVDEGYTFDYVKL